ncbi:hypothetical protein QY97_02829 [Bacillus thermotolerans]|nr:hypothetical protein QY97_02829 [Bacillus thermotolerans]
MDISQIQAKIFLLFLFFVLLSKTFPLIHSTYLHLVIHKKIELPLVQLYFYEAIFS